MKKFAIKVAFWFWFKTRGYYLWSKFWRAVLEQKRTAVAEYETMGQLEEALGKMKWVEDPLKGAFDVISSPERVQWLYQHATGDKPEVGDCDEFAVYAATAIESMRDRSKVAVQDVYFLTVNWLDAKGGFHGHNVCAFTASDGCGHISNWYGGKARRGFDTVRAVVDDVVDTGQLIAYALATPDLKLEELVLG